MKSFKGWMLAVLGIVLLSACGNVRQLQILQGTFDTAKYANYQVPEPRIQKGDQLSIVVFSDNPNATVLYNQPLTSGTSTPGTTTTQASGYLVDDFGNIMFQGLGKLHIEGLTKAELVQLLDSKMKDSLLTNPYYNIRFLNYKVTVIGEVAKPGIYSIPGEKVTVLEAMGLAGDLTISGRRDNVLVLREYNGKREFARLDLTKPDALLSPYYFLQQNDVVVVDVSKSKATATDEKTLRTITISASVLSTIAIFLNIFR